MESVYAFCAVTAGAVMLLQFALGLLGMGHDADLHDGSADLHLDHVDGLDADHDLDHGDADHGHHGDHGGTWFAGVLSFRAICTAVMIFGLAGLSAQEMYSEQTSLIIASVLGVSVLFGMAYLLHTFYGFASDGTVRDLNAVGCTGTVYLTVPANNQGRGKVTVSIQGRTMEFESVTEGDALSTGTSVLVVDVPTHNVLSVVRDESPSE